VADAQLNRSRKWRRVASGTPESQRKCYIDRLCPGPANSPKPIDLKDGRTIATLADARDLMSPVESGSSDDPAWQTCQGATAFRLKSRGHAFLGARASRSLTRTLKAEG